MNYLYSKMIEKMSKMAELISRSVILWRDALLPGYCKLSPTWLFQFSGISPTFIIISCEACSEHHLHPLPNHSKAVYQRCRPVIGFSLCHYRCDWWRSPRADKSWNLPSQEWAATNGLLSLRRELWGLRNEVEHVTSSRAWNLAWGARLTFLSLSTPTQITC